MAGQDSLIGPRRVLSTALALRGPGTITAIDAAQQRGDRQGIGMGGNVLEPGEMGVVELLAAAGGVEPHDLD